MPATSHKLSTGTRLLVAGLLVLHFVLALGSKLSSSTAMDELVHFTAGTSYWRNHDYRLQPENGILPQRWACIPVALSDTPFPADSNEGWKTSDAWLTGYDFFYNNSKDHFPRLLSGRAMIALLSVAAGLIVFLWTRSLFGTKAGLFALTLYSFCPDTLAHGALVTSDMAMTLFFLSSLALYWRHLHSGKLSLLCLSAASFGLAWVAKYSAITLLPIFGVLAMIRLLRPAPLHVGRHKCSSIPSKLLALSASFIAHGLAAVAIIWLFYGFRYSAFNPAHPPTGNFIIPWAQLSEKIGLPGQVLQRLAQWKLLPEAFLYGFTYVLRTVQSRAAFLDGQYSLTGWPSFFLFSFLYKTPLSLFFILAGTSFVYVKAFLLPARKRVSWIFRKFYNLSPLLAFLAIYWALSISSHLNIGHRHILPSYPFLFILSGVLLAPATTGLLSLRPLFKWALLLIFSLESLSAFPYFLSYYNPIAGGQANGWRHLVDSSTDWGQDLPSIAQRIGEIQKLPSPPTVYLSYFGASDHRYYQIKAEMLPCINLFGVRHKTTTLAAGTYCISATMFQQVYSSIHGAWTQVDEDRYQALAQLEPLIHRYQNDPSSRPTLDKIHPPSFWSLSALRFDELRFARLCHYLRAKGPDEVIAGSFLVFHLGQEELNQCLRLPLPEWRLLLRQAATPAP